MRFERIGRYDVTALLGEGGMGQVWQATDTQLNRQVALKILPDAFAADPDRLARFTREAQILASLNHPNIAAIYGIEEAEGTRALVLELVEGPTLADRISKGPIPLDEALPIAKQIAEALEAAHEAGVIHRDLKPANIKVREDGTVKVLDFGLAKALDPNPDADPSQSPTLTAAATQMGVIMGTAAYMSPEQASGQTADNRSDAWSFGVVLYEMLTGQRLFTGETVSHVLAKVLERELDLSALPTPTSASIKRLLRRCLERKPKRRLSDLGEALSHLEEALAPVDEAQSAVPSVQSVVQPARWRQELPLVLAASLIGAVVTGLAVWTIVQPAPPEPPRITRFFIPVSASLWSGFRNVALAISPSGTHVAYASDGQLYLRAMDQSEATPVRGADGAIAPFFSPDGQWLGFFAEGQIRKVEVRGGAPVTLCESGNFFAPSWSADDTILLGSDQGIYRVSEEGGTPELIIPTESGEGALAFPQLLPDGEHVLFTAVSTRQVMMQSLVTGERHALTDTGAGYGRYVPTGHLVYVRDGTVFGMPFDIERKRLTAGPVPLVEGVLPGPYAAAPANYAYADDGTLVFVRRTGSGGLYRLSWVDLEGHEEVVDIPAGDYGAPRLSPDGTQVALAVGDSEGSDIWSADLARGLLSRISANAAIDDLPLWTPDGQRLVFTSLRDGTRGLYARAADGTGEVERLVTFEGPGQLVAHDWSPDERTLLFAVVQPVNQANIGLLSMEGDHDWELLLDDPVVAEFGPALSPDGQWIAYVTTETDVRFEVYVQRFPDLGEKQQISINGGLEPRWSPDGRALYYLEYEVIQSAASPTPRTDRNDESRGRFRDGSHGRESGSSLRLRPLPSGSQPSDSTTLPQTDSDSYCCHKRALRVAPAVRRSTSSSTGTRSCSSVCQSLELERPGHRGVGWPRAVGRSSRKVMKVSPGSGRLVPARSGEVEGPVELLRPFNWLIRCVRVERINRRGRVRCGRGESLRP